MRVCFVKFSNLKRLCMRKKSTFLWMAVPLLLIMPVISVIYSNAAFSGDYAGMRDWDDDHIADWEWDDPRLIDHIQTHYMYVPSTWDEPYRLENPDQKDWSQQGQAGVISELTRHRRGGFFVESGAFDGETYSNTLHLEKYKNWTGLLVEPDYANFKKMLGKKRKSWLANCCLHNGTRPRRMLFYGSLYLGSLNDYVPLIKNILLRLWRPVKRTRVWCMPLYSLLLAVNKTMKIDYFSLDVEGSEMEILKSVPWDKIDVDVLEVEYTVFRGLYFDKDLSAKRREMYRKFVKKRLPRMEEARVMAWDIIFVRKDS